jgi:hypothetical protein
LSAAALQAQTSTIYGLAADRQVSSSGALSDVNPVTSGYSGTTGSSGVFVFQLPFLPVGKEFANASLRLYYAGKTGTPTFNADLYGGRISSSSAVVAGDFYAGALDGGSILLEDNFLTPARATGGAIASSPAVTDYLNAAYDGGSGAGKYVFVRVNPDAAGLNNFTRYNLNSAEASSFYKPSFSYDLADSDPKWTQVPLGGGGYVTGIVSSANGADIYIRTDVGGAFRWMPASGRWTSVTDTIIPTTTPDRAASGVMGVESIAVDPSDANKLYVTVGGNATYRGLYASVDRGATWSQLNSTFATAPNSRSFRHCGERIAVDPNNASIVWVGTIQNGLIKMVKSGSTWTPTSIPATEVPYGQNSDPAYKGGVTFVACDKNGANTILYAGVFDDVGTTGGIYYSTDGGSNWDKVGGVAVAHPFRAHMAANGTLYVTSRTVVAKAPRGGSFSYITPDTSGINYSGIAADPNDATGNIVYVAEKIGDRNSPIWRSTDGGSNWLKQGAVGNTANYNDNLTVPRGEPDGTRSVTGYPFGSISSLLVPPGVSNELWCADFFGVARTQNAQQLGGTTIGFQAVWRWLQRDQDEAVIEALKVPPYATGRPKLVVGTADLTGFVYHDLATRPSETDRFRNPADGANVTSLDYSSTHPDRWVCTVTGNTKTANYTVSDASLKLFGSGARSYDGGLTWLAFGEIARQSVASGAPAWVEWDLTAFLAKQKAAGAANVTLVLSAAETAIARFAALEYGTPANRPHLLFNGSFTQLASQDAMVHNGAQTTNYGADTTAGVSRGYNGTSGERQVYYRFSLAGVSSVTDAKLRLYRTDPVTTGATFSIGVYACPDSNWSQSTLTWANRVRTYSGGGSIGQPNTVPAYRSHGSVTDATRDLSGGRVAISATNPDNFVWMPFGTDTVPRYSMDGGITWQTCSGLPAGINRLGGKSSPSYLLIQLAGDRVNGHFYIAQLSTGSGSHTIYRSQDGGANWSIAGTVPGNSSSYNIYRCQIVASPNAGEIWFSDDGVDNADHGGLWRSTNGGGAWTRMGGVAGSATRIRGVRQIAFGAPKPGNTETYSVYFSGNYGGFRGVYRSDNYGTDWNALPALPSLIGTESLAGDPNTHNRVFLGTGGRGVWHLK